MTSIDASVLDNWPDAAAVRTAGDDLRDACATFHTDATTLKTTWQRLSAAGTYETPERDTLVTAMDNAPDRANHVEKAGESVKSALHIFADALDGLNTRRTTVVQDVADFNAKTAPDPANAVEWNKYIQEGGRIKANVTGLSHDFDAAVTDCAAAIDGIDTQGDPSDALLAGAMKWGKGPLLGLIGVAVKDWNVQQTLTYTQKVFKVFGVDLPIPFTKEVTDFKQTLLGWDKAKSFAADTKRVDSVKDWAENFSKKMRDRFLVKPNEPWEDPVKTGEDPARRFGVTTQEFEKTRTTGAGFSRWGGRALGAIGTVLGMYSEEEKRYDKLSSTQPQLSEGERRSQAVEAGIVRGGTQALATAATTAAICSVVPGVGTVGGFVVGLAVGYVMSAPITGDNKSIGDRLADGAENAWNNVKGWFH